MNLVNAIAVVLPLYFLSLLAAVIAAWRVRTRMHVLVYAGNDPAKNSSARWALHSFTALFLYYLINFIAEGLAWIHVWQLIPNYHIYTFNYLLNVPALFLFLAIHVNNKWYSWLLALPYCWFIYKFIEYKMWVASTPISFMFGVLLFSGISIASTIFLASSLISHSKTPNIFKIHLGVVILVYNFLALFIAVFMLDHRVEGIDPLIMYYINCAIAFSFYLGSAIVMFRFSKNLARGN